MTFTETVSRIGHGRQRRHNRTAAGKVPAPAAPSIPWSGTPRRNPESFMSRLETVNVGLEPDILALIDLLRRSSPDLPSRSSVIRQMVSIAIAVFTDETSVEALAEHHAEMAQMTAGAAAATAVKPV